MELQTWIGKDFLERTQRTKHNRQKKKKKSNEISSKLKTFVLQKA